MMAVSNRLWAALADYAVRVGERVLAGREKDEPMTFSKVRWRQFTVEPGKPNGWEIVSTIWSAAGPVPNSEKSVGHFLPEFSESEVREQAKSLQDHYDAVRAQRGGF